MTLVSVIKLLDYIFDEVSDTEKNTLGSNDQVSLSSGVNGRIIIMIILIYLILRKPKCRFF